MMLLNFEKSNKILVEENQKEQLISEGTKHCSTIKNNSVLTKELREAAKTLKKIRISLSEKQTNLTNLLF